MSDHWSGTIADFDAIEVHPVATTGEELSTGLPLEIVDGAEEEGSTGWGIYGHYRPGAGTGIEFLAAADSRHAALIIAGLLRTQLGDRSGNHSGEPQLLMTNEELLRIIDELDGLGLVVTDDELLRRELTGR